jgi:CRISPR type IV-associated protein Csf3
MYEPLKITAHLRCGVISDTTLPIDAILLYAAARERWGGQEMTQPGAGLIHTGHDNLLPLERVHHVPWYYHASFAQWPAAIAEGQDYWNKRLDVSLIALLDDTRRRIPISEGRYRSYHMPIFYRHALFVSWYVCGDRDGIARLLSMISHLGKKYAQGWGRVIRWEIEPMAADWSIYGPDGRPMRAIPDPQGTLYTGYRPSYWNARNQALCLMP